MHVLTTSLVLAPLVLAASLDVDHLAKRDSACTATHIFIAKGNNEPYPGRQGTLVNAICSGLASCDYEDILYYNPVEAPYCGSIDQGVSDGIAQITAYNARCPDTKLVVSGYSQGAQIVGDILGGGGGVFFQNCVQTTNAGLDINSAPGNKSKLVPSPIPEITMERVPVLPESPMLIIVSSCRRSRLWQHPPHRRPVLQPIDRSQQQRPLPSHRFPTCRPRYLEFQVPRLLRLNRPDLRWRPHRRRPSQLLRHLHRQRRCLGQEHAAVCLISSQQQHCQQHCCPLPNDQLQQ